MRHAAQTCTTLPLHCSMHATTVCITIRIICCSTAAVYCCCTYYYSKARHTRILPPCLHHHRVLSLLYDCQWLHLLPHPIALSTACSTVLKNVLLIFVQVPHQVHSVTTVSDPVVFSLRKATGKCPVQKPSNTAQFVKFGTAKRSILCFVVVLRELLVQ